MDDGRWGTEDNVNDIEANFFPRDFGMAGILARGTQQAELLLVPDCPVGSAVLVCLAGFHFNEHERIFFPSDEIDFSAAGCHALVTSRDHDSGTLQVAVRDVFAAAA